jgi:hypothetical protein
MICRSRDGRKNPDVESANERYVWRRADDLAEPSPTPLVRSLALTVALCECDVRYRQALNGPISEFVRLSAFMG